MNTLLKAIHSIVGDSGLIADERVAQRPNENLGQGSCPAIAIVRPSSTEEVSQVLKLCNEAGQVVVPQAGLTGLANNTRCEGGEIILSLERMNKIEAIDTLGATVTLEAGVVVENLQRAAEEHNLLFAVDWGARGSAQVGGMLGTNAGGNKVIRYGMARDQVLGLEVVLANGDILSNMNETLKNNTGYDLKHLFIGSEGTLGIITRAVLRLRPAAPARQTAMVACPTFQATLELLGALNQKLEGKLSAFEVMWANFYRLLVVDQKKHPAYLSPEYDFYVLIQSECVDGERGREQFLEVLEGCMEDGIVVDAIIAENSQKTEQLWALRDDIDTLARAMHPVVPYDVSLPLRYMDEYTSEAEIQVRAILPDADFVTFGHLGDGNIHFCVGPVADKAAVNKIVYGLLAKYSGSVSAEHGIGYDKKGYLKHSRSDAEINLMRTIKTAVDPNGILNPGKIFDL